MRTIMLVVLRQFVAQGLVHRLKGFLDIRVVHENDYSNAENAISSNNADIALIEIAETGEYDAEYCLSLCARLSGSNCKLFLLCPEQDELSISAAVEAKQNGQIEDFIFYDAPMDYIVSKFMA